MVINSKDGLLKHLKKTDSTKLKKNKPSLDRQAFEVKRKTFQGYTFTKAFVGLEFINCKFIDCVFENIWVFFMIFKKCKFKNCEFKNSRFSHLEFCWEELLYLKLHLLKACLLS